MCLFHLLRRKLIPDHVQSGTESHICLLIRDTISDEIISDIDVSFPLAILQLYYALVILIDNIVMDLVSLLF